MSNEGIFDTDITREEIKTTLSEIVAITDAQDTAPTPQVEEAPDAGEESPLVRLANTVIQSAIKERASDIHIEPMRNSLIVRFRIDGVMHELMQMPGYMIEPLTRRYKYLADLNLYDSRSPQQGGVGTRYDGNEYDLRVNVLPTATGQRMVIHICNRALPRISLNKLGFTPEIQAQLEEVMKRRRGMLLIVGGSGQGRTTTEYVLLDKLAQSGLSIYAVSDYYDYFVKSISQATLNRKIGYTAETALRSIADLDADVIALDRCEEKAAIQLALKLASSRAMVLHTVEASNVTVALRHLVANSGSEEAYNFVEGIDSILAQTLVRRICPECRETYEVPASDLRRFGYEVSGSNEMVELARGTGCEQCRNTGYRGRMGLFEFVTLNAEMVEMVVRRAPLTELKEAARANGMKELREDGLIKVLQGLTTPEEVERAVPMRI